MDYLLKVLLKLVMAQKIQEEVSKPRKKLATKSLIARNNDVGDNITMDETKNDKMRKKSSKDRLKKESVKLSAKDGKDGKLEDNKESKRRKKKDHKKEKKKRKKRDISGPALHITANAEPQIIDAAGDLEPQIFAQCKEKMRPVKKSLKQLDKRGDLKVPDENMKQCLIKIGARIQECMDEFKDDADKAREWRRSLWTFVSKFTEYPPKRLYKLYKSTKEKSTDYGEGNNNSNSDHHRGSSYRHHRSPRNHDHHDYHDGASSNASHPLKRGPCLPESQFGSLKRPRNDNYPTNANRGPTNTMNQQNAHRNNSFNSYNRSIATPVASGGAAVGGNVGSLPISSVQIPRTPPPWVKSDDRSDRYRPYPPRSGDSDDKRYQRNH